MFLPDGGDHRRMVTAFKYILMAGVLLSTSVVMYRLERPQESAAWVQLGDGLLMFAAALLGARLYLGDVIPRAVPVAALLLGLGWAWYTALGRAPNIAHLLYLLAAGAALGVYRAQNLDDML